MRYAIPNVGDQFTNNGPELDDDDDGERITPPGSVWQGAAVYPSACEPSGYYAAIVCPATGACINPGLDALAADFQPYGTSQ